VRRTWPRRGRTGCGPGRRGLMQSGLGVGFFAAALIWLFVGPSGAQSWRSMFVIGVLPALFALWLRRRVPASPPNASAGGPPQRSSSPARSCSHRRCSSGGLPALLVALTLNGVFTTGQYSWMAIWLPELYPTRVRGAGVASVFTASRLIACIGPLVAGGLIVALGGYGTTAETFGCIHLVGLAAVWLLPETRGRPAAGRLTRASPPPAAVMASGCPERCRPPRRPLGRRGRA